MSTINQIQHESVRDHRGFIAALDQSGGSSPGALAKYGVNADAYSGDDEMFDQIHAMRARIVTSPSFGGDRVLGAILFEGTMDREIDGRPSAEYLWDAKGVVPFLKVDKGLADESNGVQLMKPNPGLEDLLDRGRAKGIFGTKMRSVIKEAGETGVGAIVDQQFAEGARILAKGMVPILEPEVDIHSPSKAEAEDQLKVALLAGLDSVADGDQVMFKLTLPEVDGLYRELVDHPKVLKLVALSGGYSRQEANDRLARNLGMVASFSRALVEDLSIDQDAAEFDVALGAAIAEICAASAT